MLRSASFCSHIIQPQVYKSKNLVHFSKGIQNYGASIKEKSFQGSNSKNQLSFQVSSTFSNKTPAFIISRSFNTPVTDAKPITDTEVQNITVPIDATTTKTETDTKETNKIIELLNTYASLSKARLGSLVVMTTMVGYFMAPLPFSFGTILASSAGTALAVASANTWNQIIEVKHDAKMARTWNRILPKGKISKAHAIGFAVATGAAGVSLLGTFVNPLAAGLALANIALYAGVYTPLKQIHPINTHVGAIVGAIPPMIGWASRTGGLEPGAWALAALLYIWQLPHFHALAWNIRNDYAKAGYKMLCTVAPEKVSRTALLWSAATLPLGALCVQAGIATWCFGLDSLALDGYLLYHAYNFYRDNSNSNARKLFFATLAFLPLFMLLMIFHKKTSDDEKEKIDVQPALPQ